MKILHENEIYKKLYLIRLFEETLLKLFSENKLNGTTHTCIGQEAVAVAAMSCLEKDDIVFSNHRCHGHFLARFGDVELLLAEIMGKHDGLCQGRGGSQHLCHKNFFSNGIQGGIVPNATGAAFAEKLKLSSAVAMVFLGDGTLGQGIIYESFNLAALYAIPIIYVIENNEYAMSTARISAVAGSIAARPEAFGIKTWETFSNDVNELMTVFHNAASFVRHNAFPACVAVHTYRLGPHSKGDDTREPEELARGRENDPILLCERKLDNVAAAAIRAQTQEEIAAAVDRCLAKPVNLSGLSLCETLSTYQTSGSLLSSSTERCANELNKALERILSADSAAILLGEDLCDPYGGAFKVTRGLSSAFPDRVFNTPISEAGVIGLAVGLALKGFKPVVEIMFGDFLALGFDQVLNHATKYQWMYADQVTVPLLIRTPMGGGRGYGATHSQSLEKYYIGMPNLRVLALSPLHSPGAFYERLIDGITSPVLVLENKKMYGERLISVCDARAEQFTVFEGAGDFPLVQLSLDAQAQADAVLITYGGMARPAMDIARRLLIDEEILLNIVVVTQLSPCDIRGLSVLTGDTRAVFTLEEGALRAGWGSMIISELAEKMPAKTYRRFGARDCVIPCGVELESRVLPDTQEIMHSIKKACR